MATCKTCGNTCGSQGKCGCNDSVLHLPPNCNPPNCPNPEPCPETFSDCCTIHNGDTFTYIVEEAIVPGPQFTIYQGERLCDTWQRFINYYFCGTDNGKVPYGLKSTNITSTTLTIAWTPSPTINNLEYYEVFYSPVSSIGFVSAGTVPYSNTTPSLTITGLTPNTSYYVYVIVTDGLAKPCPSVSLILTTKVS